MVATVTLYQQSPHLEGRGEHQSSGKELCFANNQTMAVGTWTTHSVGIDPGREMPQQGACPLSASTQTARIEMRKPRNQRTWRHPESRRQLGVGIWKSPSYPPHTSKPPFSPLPSSFPHCFPYYHSIHLVDKESSEINPPLYIPVDFCRKYLIPTNPILHLIQSMLTFQRKGIAVFSLGDWVFRGVPMIISWDITGEGQGLCYMYVFQ